MSDSELCAEITQSLFKRPLCNFAKVEQSRQGRGGQVAVPKMGAEGGPACWCVTWGAGSSQI